MSDTSWTITDNRGNTYTIDAVGVGDGFPQFQVGQTTELTLIFNEGNHTGTYKSIRDEFGQYLYDEATETGIDYRGVPYYRQYISPRATATSYLWLLEPNQNIQGLDSWWVLVTNITDETRYYGPQESLAVTLFVVAEKSYGTRSDIQSDFEV